MFILVIPAGVKRNAGISYSTFRNSSYEIPVFAKRNRDDRHSLYETSITRDVVINDA